MNRWPVTNVHREYDAAAARERLLRDAARVTPRSPVIYDPTRPRVLERRQAETMPYWLEAVLLLAVFLMLLGAVILWALAEVRP